MKTRIVVLSLLMSASLISCHSNEQDDDKPSAASKKESVDQTGDNSKGETAQIETAFSDLGKQYSALKIPENESYSKQYTQLSAIENKLLGIRFNIFRKNKEKGMFVLTVAYKNNMRAVPIFPYTESCYWNYENEKHTCGSSELNFPESYNKMLSDLSLDASDDLAYYPYFVISHHVLFLETMRLQDTTAILDEHAYCISQDTKIARERNRKNMRDVVHLIHPNYSLYSYLSDVDSGFDYVFWAEPKRKTKKKVELVFKAFNFECKEPLEFI